jgi:hypothetical protein
LPADSVAARSPVEAAAGIDVVACELEILRARGAVLHEGANRLLEDEHRGEVGIEVSEAAAAEEVMTLAAGDPGADGLVTAATELWPIGRGDLEDGLGQLGGRKQRGELRIALAEARSAEGVVVIKAGKAGRNRLAAVVAHSGLGEVSKAVHLLSSVEEERICSKLILCDALMTIPRGSGNQVADRL